MKVRRQAGQGVNGISRRRALQLGAAAAAGVALPIATARLKVADFDQTRAVTPSDTAITFTLTLKSGPAKLQTWFYDASGAEICGAYYVYLHRK